MIAPSCTIAAASCGDAGDAAACCGVRWDVLHVLRSLRRAPGDRATPCECESSQRLSSCQNSQHACCTHMWVGVGALGRGRCARAPAPAACRLAHLRAASAAGRSCRQPPPGRVDGHFLERRQRGIPPHPKISAICGELRTLTRIENGRQTEDDAAPFTFTPFTFTPFTAWSDGHQGVTASQHCAGVRNCWGRS